MKRTGRVMGQARTRGRWKRPTTVALWAVLSGALVACAASHAPATAEPGALAPVDVRPYLARLQAVTASSGGQRPLTQLDVTGDGAIDAGDRAVFETVWQAAEGRLAHTADRPAPGHEFYHGAPKDSPSIFSLVSANDAGVDLSAVPAARVEELAIESHWAEQQTRFGGLLTHGLEGTFGGALTDILAGYNSDRMKPAAVCAGLEALDVGGLKKAGLEPIAVFDIDSTILGGNITDVFLATLVDLGLPKPEANAKLKAFLETIGGVDHAAVDAASVVDNARLLFERSTNYDLPKDEQVSAKDAFYNIVELIAGLSRDEVRTAVRHAMEKGAGPYPPWKTRIYADKSGCGMRRIIDLLGQHGVNVYLLSATPDILAEVAGEYLGVPPEHVKGSILAMKGNVYTGEVEDSTYYTKGAIARQWLANPPLFAFGDSPTSDFSMLEEAVGPAFMVNARDSFVKRDNQEAGSRMVALFFDGTEHDLAAR